MQEWNGNPRDGDLEFTGDVVRQFGGAGRASTWRHVAFIEQDAERIETARESGARLVGLGMPQLRTRVDAEPAAAEPTGDSTPPDTPEFRWLMSSDVQNTARRLPRRVPDRAMMRTEFGTVVVQSDICNGCGTCVAGCPFGGRAAQRWHRRADHSRRRAQR